MLPLSDDDLRLVTGAVEGLKPLVEKIRDYITQGHDSSTNVWKAYGQSTVR